MSDGGVEEVDCNVFVWERMYGCWVQNNGETTIDVVAGGDREEAGSGVGIVGANMAIAGAGVE